MKKKSNCKILALKNIIKKHQDKKGKPKGVALRKVSVSIGVPKHAAIIKLLKDKKK